MLLFLYRMARAAMLDAAVYEEVEADARATGQAFAVVLLSSLAAGLGSAGVRGPDLTTQLAISAIALVAWSAWAMLVLQIGTRWLPEARTEADIGQLLRTVGFAAAPGIVQVLAIQPALSVPVFVGAWIWMFAAMVIAIRQALDYRGTARALAVTGFALVLILSLVLVFGFLFGPAAASGPG